jgi:ABC-type transport system involved in multi-copper enzyme maturation permease subunit
MVSKELRDAVWKLLLVALVVLVLAPNLTPYSEYVKNAERDREFRAEVLRGEHDSMVNDPAYGEASGSGSIVEKRESFVGPPPPSAEEQALQEMYTLYMIGGALALVPLAWLLGAPLVAGEVGDGTILLLLSKPLSRARMLLTKYAACAGTLLAAVILGTALVLSLAALRGYPLGEADVTRMALAGGLMWLGSLFALALSLLVSVAFRNTLVSLGVGALALFLIITFPFNLLAITDVLGTGVYYSEETYRWTQMLSPISYWIDQGLLTVGVPASEATGLPGSGIPIAIKLLFWAVGMAGALLAALWLFRRRSF